jgi:hypothetical protein
MAQQHALPEERNSRPAEEQAAPTQHHPGGEYVTPTRLLDRAELVKIHRELDYVQRFTTRYAVLFDSHFFHGNPELVRTYAAVCALLVAMQATGPATEAHCTAIQKQFLTIEQVKEYITAVALFSSKSMSAQVRDQHYAPHFPFWEHDNAVLCMMQDGLTALVDEVTPDATNNAQ